MTFLVLLVEVNRKLRHLLSLCAILKRGQAYGCQGSNLVPRTLLLKLKIIKPIVSLININKNTIKIKLSQKHGIAELKQLAEARDKYKLAFSKATTRSEPSKKKIESS